jgi:hypothetical protein
MKKYCLDCNKLKSRKGNYCKSCGYKHRVRPNGLVYKITKENIGYGGLHFWVYKVLGKPLICSWCKSIKNIQWANVSHQYKRDIKDWLSLCAKCHNNYDRQTGWGKAAEKYGVWL